jgi:hypothetical protein
VTKQNPFLSDSFKSIWLKHFTSRNTSVKAFKYISDLQFVKHKKWPLYINVGETLTKGIAYNLKPDEDSDLKNDTLLIYDVPTYFNIDTPKLGSQVKLLKSRQYPGFLIETGMYKSLSEYMSANFSKNSRNKNNKYKRRLEASFNISYKMFFGEITKDEYDFIFEEFKLLLEKRFAEKQVSNNNLNSEEWNFYYEVAYTLILEKKASLYVIYDNNQPIGVTLSYFSEDTLFDAITVFDIDYFKFHLGSITIMKLIEWCIENDIKILDFSKGYFEYKRRWCTKSYDFEYHIYYDTKSLKSKLLAHSIKGMYDFKQRLRDKNINEKVHKLTYKLKKREQSITPKVTFNFEETSLSDIDESLIIINYKQNENNLLRLMIFEFLYLYEENYNTITLFQLKNKDNSYLIKGQKKSIHASIN